MAKTYSSNSDTGASTEGGAQQTVPSSTPYAKLIPIVVGLLALLLIIGAIMRAQTTRDTVPGATSGASGTTGPAARPNGAGPQER